MPGSVLRTRSISVELTFDHPHFNVTVGGSETREYRVSNKSVAEQEWKLSASVPWMKIEPDHGVLAAGQDLFVKLSAAPPGTEAATLENTFTFQAAGKLVDRAVPFKTFVIPAYVPPAALPMGRVMQIERMEPKRLKSHVTCAKGTLIETGVVREWGAAFTAKGAPTFGETNASTVPPMLLLIGKHRFSRALWVTPAHESVYDLTDSGISSFGVSVGVTKDARHFIRALNRRVNFEIYVDGKLRIQSGIMSAMDEARLLAVEGLEQAKELKLVTRLDSDEDDPTYYSCWADANFYTKKPAGP